MPTKVGDLKSKPGLLVSVRDAIEAEAAISGGADWIDLKEPLTGPLGAVSISQAVSIVTAAAGRRPLSAALGELSDWPSDSTLQLLSLPEVSYMKLGLAEMGNRSDWHTRWHEAEEIIAKANKLLVPVVYADWRRANAPPPEQVMELALESKSDCLLIDTFDKKSGGTLAVWGNRALGSFLREAKKQGLSVILAGKITRGDLSAIPRGSLDLVAIRGAACGACRTSAIDEVLVSQFKQQLVSFHHGTNSIAVSESL